MTGKGQMKDVLIGGKNRVTISIEVSNLLMGLASEFRYMIGGSGGVWLMIQKELETRKGIRSGGGKIMMVEE